MDLGVKGNVARIVNGNVIATGLEFCEIADYLAVRCVTGRGLRKNVDGDKERVPAVRNCE
jgi:hypothetical protein